MKILNKLINHITLNGKKETGEKNIIKSIKNLQKSSFKKTSEIVKLALIYSTPIFKIHKIKNKKKKKKNQKIKEIPGFIKDQKARISLAIKFILQNIKKKEKNNIFYEKFTKEILLNATSKSNSIQFKNELQKNVLTKKRYLFFYRWK
jgi:ribosomal protein S7